MRSRGRTHWVRSLQFHFAIGIPALTLIIFSAGPVAAGLLDSRLLVRWETRPFDGATVEVLTPGGGLGTKPLPPTPTGSVLFPGLAAGRSTVVLRDGSGRILRSWAVFLPSSLTTVVAVDAGEGTLTVSPSHPDPFGNVLTWSDPLLTSVPGAGVSGALQASLPLASTGLLLNGGDHGPVTRLRSPEFGIEEDAVGIVVPLGAAPAHQQNAAVGVWTDRAARNTVRVTGAGGSGGEGTGVTHLELVHSFDALGRMEVEGAFQGRNVNDIGPLGFGARTGDENDLQGLETRWTAFCRPARVGLVRLDFHAAGQSRRHFLQEFAADTEHAPREDRSTLRSSGTWELPAGPARLTFGAAYTRSYSETGDGEAFDRIENYRIGSNENAESVASDEYGLYWRGSSARVARIPHLFNYYTQDLTTSWTYSVEGQTRLAAEAPLRLGLALERTTWRWYEHLDPIVDSNLPGGSDGGYQLASYLGYSRDAADREDLPGHEAPHPRTTTGFIEQALPIGPAVVEAGIRWSAFSPDQKPLRDLDHPMADAGGLSASDLTSAPTRRNLDPRLGVHLPFAAIWHLWANLGGLHAAPPNEMLYYSENVLTQFATQDLNAKHPTRYQVFGNPAVKPEATTDVSLACGRDLGGSGFLRVTGRWNRTSDTWVARRHAPSGELRDSLACYENGGHRRERSLRLDLEMRPLAHSTLLGSYTWSARETDVIEPAPLYRALLLPDSPVQGTGTLETSPLAPLWFDDRVDRDWFPSLLDQRHRIGLTWLSRLGAISEGTAAGTLLSDLDLTVGLRAASGLPYTRTYLRPEGLMVGTATTPAPALAPGQPIDKNGNGVIDGDEINSERMPWSWQLDLGVRRGLRLLGQSFSIAAEVTNVTNRKNPRLVYGATGEADDDGWLDSSEGRAYLRTLGESARAFADAYGDRVDNPNRYDTGRAARASLSWQF